MRFKWIYKFRDSYVSVFHTYKVNKINLSSVKVQSQYKLVCANWEHPPWAGNTVQLLIMPFANR